ncbi:MAG: hypothetical protein JO165_03620 [Candidatus Eremiobacteraeota bacterium]|nr:hypothetical protein [Candidatus Eremiobacteraeota bacterium]
MRYAIAALCLFAVGLICLDLLRAPSYTTGLRGIYAPDRSSMLLTTVPPAARAAGIRAGDRLLLRTGADRLFLTTGVPHPSTVVVPIQRQGEVRFIPIRAETPSPPLRDAAFVAAGAAWVLGLLIVAFVGFRRPGIMMLALAFYACGGLGSPDMTYFASLFGQKAYGAIYGILVTLFGSFPNAALASFAVRFPQGDSKSTYRRTIHAIDAAVLAALAIEALYEAGILHFGPSYGTWYLFGSAVLVAIAALLAIRHTQPAQRGRVLIVFAAIVLSAINYAAALALSPNYNLLNWVVLPSGILVPAAVAYAILRHRIFDVGFVLNRTLVFGITSAVVIVVLAALEQLVQQYVTTLSRPQGAAVQFGIALAVVLLARNVHRRVDVAVDNLFFRVRHLQERALREFATTAQFYTEGQPLLRDAVDVLVRHGTFDASAIYLVDGMAMRSAISSFSRAVPLVDGNDPAVVRLRAVHQPLDLHNIPTAFPGTRAYPMTLAGRSLGTVTLGERESAETIPPDIDDAIRTMIAAIAIALETIESARLRRELAQLRANLSDQQYS